MAAVQGVDTKSVDSGNREGLGGLVGKGAHE